MMTLTMAIISTSTEIDKQEHTARPATGRLLEHASAVTAWGDNTYRAAITQQRVHLYGCLADLRSEYEDAAQAIATATRGGPCVAMGALQAQLNACHAEMVVVQVALAALRA